MKELKDNLLDEPLTSSDAENIDNGFQWLILGVIKVEDKVKSRPLKSEPDEFVTKLDGKADTGKELGNQGESKSAKSWPWLSFWFRRISQHAFPHPGQSTLFSAPFLTYSVVQT